VRQAAVRLERLGDLIQGVGQSVLDAARAAEPDEASITFGVEIVVKPGKAVAVLADGEAKASLEVNLVWKLDERRARSAATSSPAATSNSAPASTTAPASASAPAATSNSAPAPASTPSPAPIPAPPPAPVPAPAPVPPPGTGADV